mgnify:CR=1 FL=1
MGGDWYCRANGEALFEIAKPIRNKGIGVDNIPLNIRNSSVLTGNNLGRLGNCERLPEPIEIQQYSQDETIQEMKLRFKNDRESFDFHLHQYAKEVLESGDVQTAWKILLPYRSKIWITSVFCKPAMYQVSLIPSPFGLSPL